MIVLGIDTSCDDTSCAVVEDGVKLLSNVVSSQVDLHSKYGGVVPELASRKHMEMITPVTEEALAIAGVGLYDIGLVAVTEGPGLLGSLLVGVSFAKSLALGLGVPLVGVHHLEGHMFSNFLNEAQPSFPCLNLVVSGGHSDLIIMRGFGSYEVVGETRDDAAGEVFDKVAREMGLPFPGGPHLDKIADGGDSSKVEFTHPKLSGNKYDFSFSGTKTKALQAFASGDGDSLVQDVSASLRKAVVRDLLYHVPGLLSNKTIRSFAVSGGVAANSLLRSESARLAETLGIPLHIPPKDLCTDNGAMIASAGFRRYQKGIVADTSLGASSGLSLESW